MVPKSRFVVFGTSAVSQYTKVETVGANNPAVVFPLAAFDDYTTVSYTVELSARRQTMFRARAVTVQGPDGGLIHHVIETIEQEQKAIEHLFAIKQVPAADIAKRVFTKNTARCSLAADKRGHWNIPASKHRDSYKTLMMLGLGEEPGLVFASFFAKHIIGLAGDESPAKRPKIAADAVVPTTPVAAEGLEPVVCQNLLWSDELEALIARAPPGVEKKFVTAFFNMVR
tara:strand:+ start:1504 stop:2187 length:684 start_codon:yes stop_codon:yes gene_type:complete